MEVKNNINHGLFAFAGRGLWVVLAVAFLLLIFTTGLSADNNQRQMQAAIVEVDEEITAGTAQFIARTLYQAEADGADIYVLLLNTPGGLIESTRTISKELQQSELQTVVFVNKPSGWAYSAGSYILLSADIAAAQPGASLGAAGPVDAAGRSAEDKTEQAMRSWIRSLAEAGGRDPDLAEQLVADNLTLSGREAQERGLIDYTSEDLSGLFARLGYQEVQQISYERNNFERVMAFLSLPFLVPLFLTLGVIGLVFAFRSGEPEVTGIPGALFLLLGLWGSGSIELSVLGILLLLGGVLLLVWEFFLAPGDFGLSGFFGVVVILVGVISFANEPLYPSYFSQLLFWLVLAVAAAVAVAMVVIGQLTARTFTQPVKVGPETLVGREAELLSASGSTGVVKLDGERWSARFQDGVENITPESESKVEIVKVEGNTLVVRRVSDQDQTD